MERHSSEILEQHSICVKMAPMVKKTYSTQRQKDSLSRERIIEVSIEILDESGESGLTFRALSQRLETGPGAIYWHIDNRSALLTAACDAIIAGTVNLPAAGAKPAATIRTLALGMFDAIDAHPWVGAALTRAPWELPMVRVLECLGQQVRALRVPAKAQWATVSALLHYILGVGGQNAANTHIALTQGTDRTDFLEDVATAWSQLDANDYPFTRSIAAKLSAHDDRADFLAGIDLILRGIESMHGR